MTTFFRCWAVIDMGAIRSNLRTIRSMVSPGVRLVVVVKADAYGHGIQEVTRQLDKEVDLFGVANLSEAQNIRLAGARAPVLILGPALPEERETICQEAFIPSVSTVEEATAYAKCARPREPVPVHLVIDTGMGRIGSSEEEAEQVFRAIQAIPQLQVKALSSHLPVADEDEHYTTQQLERFRTLTGHLPAGNRPAAILNSAGVMRFGKQIVSGDLVRVGLSVYGISPLSDFQHKFQPAMTLKTRVILVRSLAGGRSISYGRTFVTPGPMRVATLSVGYGDGFDRHLSGQKADVLIRGHRCRMLGRVTMDQIMVDVTHLEQVKPGDEVVLIGRQDDQEILASELATKAGTIAWEIFTGITKRVPRIYC